MDLRAYLQRPGLIASALLIIAWYALLRGARGSMWRIALLSLPGTVAHEAAHLLVGLVLGAGPQGFSILPKPAAGGWRLGSVSFSRIGLINGAGVALAPLLLLPLAWLGLTAILLPLWEHGQWGWWLLAGYLTATALFAALPSWQDIKLGGRSLAFYALLGVLVALVYTHWPSSLALPRLSRPGVVSHGLKA